MQSEFRFFEAWAISCTFKLTWIPNTRSLRPEPRSDIHASWSHSSTRASGLILLFTIYHSFFRHLVYYILSQKVCEIILSAEFPLVDFFSNFFFYKISCLDFGILEHIIKLIRHLKIFQEFNSFQILICISPSCMISGFDISLHFDAGSPPGAQIDMI